MKKKTEVNTNTAESDESGREEQTSVVGSVNAGAGTFCRLSGAVADQGQCLTVRHHNYSDEKGRWLPGRPAPHPSLVVRVTVCPGAYGQTGAPVPGVTGRTVKAAALPDTGAQMSVCGMNLARALGVKREELFDMSLAVSAANQGKLTVVGGMFLAMEGLTGGRTK